MAIDAKPPGPFGYPTLLSQWVLFIQSGRYKNSRTAAASFVPHQYFSGAKISIIPETFKQFPKFNIKQRDAGLKYRVPYVLSYYNNYVNRLPAMLM
jgi:hypothetical protein